MTTRNGFAFPDHVSSRDRVVALLLARGLKLGDFAAKYGHNPTEVSMMLSCRREYPEIRDDLATELADFGIDRETIDAWFPYEKVA